MDGRGVRWQHFVFPIIELFIIEIVGNPEVFELRIIQITFRFVWLPEAPVRVVVRPTLRNLNHTGGGNTKEGAGRSGARKTPEPSESSRTDKTTRTQKQAQRLVNVHEKPRTAEFAISCAKFTVQ